MIVPFITLASRIRNASSISTDITLGKLGALNRRSVVNILKSGLDSKPLPITPAEQQAAQTDWISPLHDNVRGSSYFH